MADYRIGNQSYTNIEAGSILVKHLEASRSIRVKHLEAF
jgi:hypothetical protein